uniref:hypothetical protein n=1 Tax=Dissulfurimicrobium sp. TaxID=2022436 RepID=UPI00404B05A9
MREIGVEANIESYGVKDLGAILGLAFISPSHRKFLNGLMLMWESDGFIFVHSGFNPGIKVKDQTARPFMR